MDAAIFVGVGIGLSALVIVALMATLRSLRALEALRDRSSSTERRLLDDLERLRSALGAAVRDAGQGTADAHARASSDLREALARTTGELWRQLNELRDAQTNAITRLGDRVDERLSTLRTDNAGALEAIRTSIDERLQTTLEARLGESFRLVGEQLDRVSRGLGEMQAMASGVGDLRRVLSNVRARGTFGEAQLGTLLADVLTPDQFATNVATVPASNERVEFALRLPGRDEAEGPVWLPIDAKFPQEDFDRLMIAHEAADAASIELHRQALRRRILTEGQRIQAKYVSPPHTTDFAVMFLPTEGLYAEVLRIEGLVDELQSRHRVIPSGPTTLWALLSSLQMGFRTVAIERRSVEVRRLLGAVKTDLQKLGASLDAVSKKLDEASSKMREGTQRARLLDRKLSEVEALPPDAANRILTTSEPT